jgi:phosphonate degradation associated HDIG domain protein
MALTIDEIVALFETRGTARYGGEAINQREHALQCAALAERAGETDDTVTAALLHDLGHLLQEANGVADSSPTERDDLHQFVALPFLRGVFSSAVLEPIRLHVDAKRYLCAVDSTYWATLSDASKRSLVLQGGVYSESEAAAFIAQPFAPEASRLRRYDDLAKVPDAPTAAFSSYITTMKRVSSHG